MDLQLFYFKMIDTKKFENKSEQDPTIQKSTKKQ